MNRRLSLILILISLFLAAWLPRVLGLDVFVTPDERKWLARSGNFYQALSEGDLVHTFQREHPGVTVMWAGMLGFLERFPEYAEQAPGQFAWKHEEIEGWLLANSSHTPLEMLVAGRWWIVLAISLTLVISIVPLRRLFGEQVALLALFFLLWDPFHIALSRQLHPDGLAASLSFLALISFLAWLHGGYRRYDLLLSAIAMGLAWLTKSPTILVAVVAGLLVGMVWLENNVGIGERGNRNRRGNRRGNRKGCPYMVGFVGWGLVALLVFVGLWPAMWVEPLGTLSQMAAETSDYVEGHVNANYFFGQPTEDPGLFFYPVAYLFRTTPVTLIGLLAALLLALKGYAPFDRRRVTRAAFGLLFFALFFTVVITVGAKKFDRYLLPVFLPLDVLAALGWIGLVRLRSIGIALSPLGSEARARRAILTLLVAIQLLPALLTYPYYLTYYNPLVGGSATAAEVLFVGWGEGLEQAAHWLNEQSFLGGGDTQQRAPSPLHVTAWYADGPFSYFFDGEYEILSNITTRRWLDSDFFVIYVNQWQREEPSAEVIEWFFEREPAYEVEADGLSLVRVYDVRDEAVPDFLDWNDERRADFGGKIRLVGYELEQTEAQAGDSFLITLYERSLAPMEIDYNVLVRLLAPDGSELWRHEGWPWGAPTSDWPLRTHRPDGHEVVIPKEAPAGLYALTVSFYDPATFDALPVSDIATGEPTGQSERVIDLIRIAPAPTAKEPLKPVPTFASVASLRAVTLPKEAQRGNVLPLALEWHSEAHTPSDYTVFIHLVAPDGTVVAQQDRQPLNGFAPTRLWDAGESFLDEYEIPLPSDMPAEEYDVRVGLYTIENGRLLVFVEGAQTGDFVTIGKVSITE